MFLIFALAGFGLAFLRGFRGWVFPWFADFGSLNVNSKVPPIARLREENDGRLCRAGWFRWSFAAQLA